MGKFGDIRKLYQMRCFTFNDTPTTPAEVKHQDKDDMVIVTKRKPGGWKSMPFIIGNETFERLATFGMIANFTVYLVNHLHLPQTWAANASNIWFGTTNFAPLLGAFLSDAYLGRFQTLAYSCVSSFIGMLGLTLTASIPQLRPPPCSPELQQQGWCAGPPGALLGLLFVSLGFLTVGAGGIRPCSLPFGVDQFDPTTDKGRKGINSFFNWYYFTFTAAVMVALTLVVYIQDSISWALGLGIPTALMLVAIVLFFLGTRVYVYVPPEGSVLSGIAQVLVAAYKKRSVELPHLCDDNGGDKEKGLFYDPSPNSYTVTKLPLTNQFRFLNKAAVILEGEELKPDGAPVNPWRLCSIQKIEELKCLIRVAPIWASGIICFTAIVQQGTFTVLQAMKMDRHLGPHFQIPPGSLGIISMLTMTIFIPIYDRFFVPAVTRLTGQEGGITILQRMGAGNAMSILSMVVAGLAEKKRRASAVEHGDALGRAPLSVMWLAPQLALMGVSEALNGIAQIEFYYKEFPEHMRSIAGSLFFCSLAGSSYLSSLILSVVEKNTGKPNWLDNNINVGRVDRFYYLIAAMGGLNLVYFVVCARYYRYKGGGQKVDGKVLEEEEEKEKSTGGDGGKSVAEV